MDPKTIEINQLRLLNDYLNQTIDLLVRAHRFGPSMMTPGLSHSTFGATSPLGSSPFSGVDPVQAGLGHSSYGAWGSSVPFGASPLTAASVSPFYPAAVDPFSAQRGLFHSPAASAWATMSPIADLVRQQEIVRQQQLQNIAARQVEALLRGY